MKVERRIYGDAGRNGLYPCEIIDLKKN